MFQADLWVTRMSVTRSQTSDPTWTGALRPKENQISLYKQNLAIADYKILDLLMDMDKRTVDSFDCPD